MKKVITILLVAFSFSLANANTITLGTISSISFCPGDSLMVPFTTTGTFNVGNTFTVELWRYYDSSFSAPSILGTLNSINADTIHCVFSTLPPCCHYRIRIRSSSPVVISDTSITLVLNWYNFTVFIAAYGPTTFCSGDSLVIGNVTGGCYTFFEWYRDNVPIIGSNSDTIHVTTGGFYTLRLGTPCDTAVSGTAVFVTVFQSPVLTITGDTLICIGGNSILVASGAYSYSWSPPNNLNQSNTPLVSASPTVQTTYTVTGTAINSCTSTASITIHVSPLPVVHAFAMQDTICSVSYTHLTLPTKRIV